MRFEQVQIFILATKKMYFGVMGTLNVPVNKQQNE